MHLSTAKVITSICILDSEFNIQVRHKNSISLKKYYLPNYSAKTEFIFIFSQIIVQSLF